MSARERLLDELAAETFEVNGGSAVYFRTAIKYVDRAWQAREAECEGLREALRGLMQLTGHDGKFLYVKEHGLPMTNGDQDIIDKAFIRAESALSGKREEK